MRDESRGERADPGFEILISNPGSCCFAARAAEGGTLAKQKGIFATYMPPRKSSNCFPACGRDGGMGGFGNPPLREVTVNFL